MVIYLSLQDARCQRETDFYQEVARQLLNRPAVRGKPALTDPLTVKPLERQAFSAAMEGWKAQGVLPVLCLDEFEALFQYTAQFDDGFYDNLRALMDCNALMLVAASQKELDVYRRQHRLTSSFFNLGHILNLGELTEDEATDLLRLPASTIPGSQAALGVEEQRIARQWGGKHPYRLSLAGYMLCQARQQGKGIDWAKAQFEGEARRLPRPRLNLRKWWRPIRWLVWDIPAHLGRLAKGIGESLDKVTNWFIGLVILIVIGLAVWGVLNREQVIALLRKALGG